MLKNETIVETPEDVDGVLELCHVLIKDQTDSGVGMGSSGPHSGPQPVTKDVRRIGAYHVEREELAEEQGWVARMVHLFRAESLQVQFEVWLRTSSAILSSDLNWQLLQTARRHFDLGADRMRFTFPALITSSIKLCRRYKNREHLV